MNFDVKTGVILRSGELIADRYKIIDHVGSGAFARVYKALELSTDDTVALKVLDPLMALDEVVVSQLVNELKITRKLRHENIVSYFSLEQIEPLKFIVMEFVDGKTLYQRLAEEIKAGNKWLPVEEVLNSAEQICAALQYAHNKKVLHRDIKPNNILVDKDGTVKVADFGIARIMASSNTATKMKSTGTPPYMSPEQLRGARNLDARSDLYSLSATLYHLLAGQPPFFEPDIFNKVLNLSPEPLHEIRPDLQKDVLDVITHGLNKDPGDRDKTAREFWNAIATKADLSQMEKKAHRKTSPAGESMAAKAKPAAVDASDTQERSREEYLAYESFIEAKNSGSVEKLEIFIACHPNSSYVESARELIKKLGSIKLRKIEQKAFEKAKLNNTIRSWRKFIDSYPDSNLVAEARKSIELLEKHEYNLKVESAFKSAQNVNTISAWSNFLETFPSSKYEDYAREQLGKLKDEDEARKRKHYDDVRSREKRTRRAKRGKRARGLFGGLFRLVFSFVIAGMIIGLMIVFTQNYTGEYSQVVRRFGYFITQRFPVIFIILAIIILISRRRKEKEPK